MDQKHKRQLWEKTMSELKNVAKDLRKEIVETGLNRAIGKVKDVHQVSKKRDELAAVLTIINAKQLADKTK